MSAPATRNSILAALEKFAPRPLDVPELGGTIWVRPLTVGGFARLHRHGEALRKVAADARATAEADPHDQVKLQMAEASEEAAASAGDAAPLLMLIDCVVDHIGKPLLSDADLPLISRLPGQVSERIFAAIQDISALSANGAKGAEGN
jgi:hypothetical protein